MDNPIIFYEKEFGLVSKKTPFDFSKLSLQAKRERISKNISYQFEYPVTFKNQIFNLSSGDINVIIFYPNDYDENDSIEYPSNIYIHGAGWCLDCGDYKVPVEVCHFTKSIVYYPMYSLAPEIKFPQPVEELYEILLQIKMNVNKYKVDINNINIIGDSAGGNMALALSQLCKQRGGPKINKQVLFNPPCDYKFDTPSFNEFKEGFMLRKSDVKWCFDTYMSNESDIDNILLCPLKSTKEQLTNLPETFILHADYDVLKDDGLQLSKNLSEAGVKVTSLLLKATTHSFLIFDQLKNTNASKIALNALVSFLKDNNKSKL